MQTGTSSQKVNLIYLLGAGRSGTTLLAAVLGNQENITTVGEMHQFLEHVADGKSCSCGEKLNECDFWKSIIQNTHRNEAKLLKRKEEFESLESHKNIPSLLIKNTPKEDYLSFNEDIFLQLKHNSKADWLVDSSKYLARYLRLKESKNIQVKGIYLVRDVRGVINSFKKQVQTPKRPFSAILYYYVINLFAEFIYRTDKHILKIRYEDFVDQPEQTLKTIFNHINLSSVPSTEKNYEMPHIIGGNRMKSNTFLKIKKDKAWNSNISRGKQVLYYMLTFPLMLLNKYKV